MRAVIAHVVLLTVTLAAAAHAVPCGGDGDCGLAEVCQGEEVCALGVCVPAFALPRFPIPPFTAYEAAMIAVLDHTGPFYTRCCDDDVTAFTGERADRADGAVLCPVAGDDFPACLQDGCLCGFAHPEQLPYAVNGAYSSPFGPAILYYAGHAGYDFGYGFGTPIVAPRDGTLCKAVDDPVNGRAGFPTAWDAFHAFYIDHGAFAGRGMATWYLHAADLTGSLAALTPGTCATVVEGQSVATVGAAGTGLPHLHFEVRRYEVADGPEAGSARVIDPYGWIGASPDPWANPSENAQAETQEAPLWVACGDGRIACDEACDDGERRQGDGCDGACTVEVGFVCEGEPSRCHHDTPIGAQELRLRRTVTGRERMIFTTVDAGVPFPLAGSPDDPASGTPGGMTIELLSATGDESMSLVPRGVARPGWSIGPGGVGRYRYLNPRAPSGGDVRLVVLRQGRVLRIVTPAFDLPLAGAQGAVAVRVTFGTRRACALFDVAHAEIAADAAGRFRARNAARPILADCTRASLLGP